MVSIDTQEVIRRLELTLSQQMDLETFISWFFAEHGRVASIQADQRIHGETTLEQQVAASRSNPGWRILGELFMDLEEYRTEEERGRGEIGIDEAELRQRLKCRLEALKGFVGQSPLAGEALY